MNGANTEVVVLNKIKDLLSPNNGCVGFETLSVTTSAKPLASIPATATSAIIQVESTIITDAIRFREDGVAPTNTVGMFASNGDKFDLISAQSLQSFRVIQGTAGTTQLNVSYYK
jgi:hypothetical protein